MKTASHPECDRWRELLPASGDDELAPADRDALAKHLAGCAACRDAAEHETEFGRWLRGRVGATVAPPDALRERIERAWAGAPAPTRPAWVRVLASDWTPRIAMAAML